MYLHEIDRGDSWGICSCDGPVLCCLVASMGDNCAATVLQWRVLGLRGLLPAAVLQWVVEVLHFDVVGREITFGFIVGVDSECDWLRSLTRTMCVVVKVGLLSRAGRV